MKRKTIKLSSIIILMLFFATSVLAVPAKRGIWIKINLVDGKEVKAQLVGDEWFHYYQDYYGNAYVEKEKEQGKYMQISKKKLQKLIKKSMKRRNKMIQK